LLEFKDLSDSEKKYSPGKASNKKVQEIKKEYGTPKKYNIYLLNNCILFYLLKMKFRIS